MTLKHFNLLLVDDNPADVRVMREAICQCSAPCSVHLVDDGERALDFLYRRNGYKEAPRPDLVLLEPHIPKLDGFDLLRIVKQNPDPCGIPVIVFSASRTSQEVQRAYNLRANAYVVKPSTLDSYLEIVNAIGKYWLTIVSLPSEDDSA